MEKYDIDCPHCDESDCYKIEHECLYEDSEIDLSCANCGKSFQAGVEFHMSITAIEE